MHKNAAVAGRIIYAMPFALFGVNHLIYGRAMAGIVPAWMPWKLLLVYLVGVALLAASVSFLTRRLIWPAGIGLAVLLFIFVLTIHIPMFNDPELMQVALINALKDTALAGAALAIAGASDPEVEKEPQSAAIAGEKS